MIYEFKEYDGVNQTPAIALIARAWPEIIAAGNDYWETLYREQISLNRRIAEAFQRRCSVPDAATERE